MTFALYTDRYELTMLQAALRSGKAQRQCVFEVFARHLPPGRRFGVVAGTGRVLEAIAQFKFEEAELDYLRTAEIVDESTLDYLADYRFRGQIEGYREGELYFADSPVLSVTGSFADSVILETLILSILNYDSAVASAAARMNAAAGERVLVEMGARRAHEEAAVAAARAAYIAGFSATSNLEAGRKWGVPTMGTSAHSFTLLHDSEKEAFTAQIESQGERTTLLVDTYDISAAVALAVEITGGKVAAVRIDSGDLGQVAIAVRKQLDDLGAKDTKIVVTSDLDEYTIAALAAAPVDRYGVGTSLVTGSGHPTAGFVYKLVAHSDGGEWVDVAKKSKDKASRGGKKQAARELEGGIAIAEQVGSQPVGRPLQTTLWDGDSPIQTHLGKSGVEAAREHYRSVIAELPPTALRLSKGEPAIPTLFV